LGKEVTLTREKNVVEKESAPGVAGSFIGRKGKETFLSSPFTCGPLVGGLDTGKNRQWRTAPLRG